MGRDIRERGVASSIGPKMVASVKLAILFSLLFFPLANAEPVWRIEVQTGSTHNFETTLTIDQEQGQDFRFSADYDTKPFTGAPYSAWRISRWKKNRGWEVEYLHHKIYLKNTPPGIHTFRISNGYNMFFLNHSWERHGFALRLGAGVVVAFPIANIEGVTTDGGYRLAGIGAQAAIGKRFYIGRRFFLTAEGKLTLAAARVLLNDADANAPNIAVHGLAGIGFDL